MLFYKRRTLGNETTPVDEPFLTAVNTSGETLEQMRVLQQNVQSRLGKSGWGGRSRVGANQGIPERGRYTPLKLSTT